MDGGHGRADGGERVDGVRVLEGRGEGEPRGVLQAAEEVPEGRQADLESCS